MLRDILYKRYGEDFEEMTWVMSGYDKWDIGNIGEIEMIIDDSIHMIMYKEDAIIILMHIRHDENSYIGWGYSPGRNSDTQFELYYRDNIVHDWGSSSFDQTIFSFERKRVIEKTIKGLRKDPVINWMYNGLDASNNKLYMMFKRSGLNIIKFKERYRGSLVTRKFGI